MINEKNVQKFRKLLGYQYPPTLKKVCMDETGLGPEYRMEQIVAQATPYIFDFTYPMWNEAHKQILEQKIIKRYFYRQISCTDVDEWRFRLDAKMNEIMPYYNQMYESVGLLTDVLDDVEYTRIFDEANTNTGIENTASTQRTDSESQNTGTRNGSTRDASESLTVNAASDTPQGQLTGLLNNTYLSAATKTDVESSNESSDSESRTSQGRGSSETAGTFDTSSSKTGQRNYTEKVKGKMYPGSKAKVIMEYRKAILNIDAEIVGRMSDLFMLTYNPYYDEEEDGEEE